MCSKILNILSFILLLSIEIFVMIVKILPCKNIILFDI